MDATIVNDGYHYYHLQIVLQTTMEKITNNGELQITVSLLGSRSG